MAIAISAPRIGKTSSQTRAATWTGISAGIALLATIPLVMLLARPVSQVLFVRGTEHDGDWGHAFLLIMVLLAPATYALFFGTTGELLKTRVSSHVHRATMRVAAMGMLPYLAMCLTGVYWQSGPQESLMISGGLTIPLAMAATIWASAQNHPKTA